MVLKKVVLCSAIAALTFSAQAANVPVGYSVYSYEDLKIGDRAGMNGGTIGCKSNVLIGYDAVVSTDIIAKGSVTLHERANIDGAVTAGGTVSLGAGVVISKGFTANATVPAYTIPTKTFATGTANKVINYDATGTAAPGNYNKIEVLDRGTITLSSGTYNCNSFKISYDAKINMNMAGGPIIINVKNEFNFKDRAVMLLPAGNDGSAIDIYYNGATAVIIGNSSYAYGTFTAPNAAVTVSDNAHFSGSLFAKKVELQPGLFATNMIDRWLDTDADGDNVPDYVEDKGDCNPNNASSTPLVVVSGTYENQTDRKSQKVTLSAQGESGYSRVFSMVFDKGSLQGDLIPIVDITPLPATSVAVPDNNGNYRLDGPGYGRIYHIEGEVTVGKKVYFGFPLSDASLGIPKEFIKLYHYNENASTWEQVTIDKIENGVAYAWASSFSDWASVVLGTVYKVGTSTTPGLTYDYSTIDAAISAVLAHPKYYLTVTDPVDAFSFAILVQGGTVSSPVTYTVNSTLKLPIRTSIIGGFNDADFTPTMTSLSDPKSKVVKLVPGTGLSGSMMEVTDLASYIDVDVYIDGFTFESVSGFKFANMGDAALNLSSGSHYKNILVRNCVFNGFVGQEGSAAVFLFNVSNVTIESCFFVNNTIESSTTSGGSAIYAYLISNCGVGVDVKSCVFCNNSATTTLKGSTVTEYRTGGAVAATRYMNLYNCTFYSNTSTTGPGAILAMGDNGTPFVDNYYIKNNIFDNNTSNQVEIVTSPATSFTDATNIFVNPGFVSTSDLDGTDNVWGTVDDGLMLTKASTTCINKATYFEVPKDHSNLALGTRPLVADHDAIWRLRNGAKGTSVNSSDYKHDIGAYERYTKVMCVGSTNTVGITGACYQEFLKGYSEAAGFPIDFVGISGKGFTAQAENVGGDPFNPQAEKRVADNQGACEAAGTVSSLGSLSTSTVDCDFALVMVGDAEMGTLTFANALIYAQSLVKTGRNVLMTDMVPDVIMGENATFNTAFKGTQAVDFGTVKKCTPIGDVTINSKKITNFTIGLPNTPGDKAAFQFIAKSFWDQMATLLP